MKKNNISHVPWKTRNIHDIVAIHNMQGDLETLLLFIRLKPVKDR